MTRFLSDSLQATEPSFRQSLKLVEAKNGAPNHDIHLSLDVMHSSKKLLESFGLDSKDTTPEEAYYLLKEHLKMQDTKLTKTLRSLAAHYVSAEGDVVSGMVYTIKNLPDVKHCFAIKSTSFKAIMRKLPPKRAMKKLGYRSLDSFLKHESLASMLTAGKLFENQHWQTSLLDAYTKLTSRDFEERAISVSELNGGRWIEHSKAYVSATKHNVLSFKELGALVLLPLPQDAPAGTVTSSLGIALNDLNDIKASSTYLKMSQVRPNFGKLIKLVVIDEALREDSIFESTLPWRLAQRYYSKFEQLGADLLDAPLKIEDIAWRPIEEVLSSIEPSFKAWTNSSHLGLLEDRKPVSLNLLDNALNTCNNLPFENRIVHYFQRSLLHELLLKYLIPDSDEPALNQLKPQLAEEMAY